MILAKSNRLIGHLDMNSFFATVEQQSKRALRGRPLGVCAYLGKHGCIIAPSIEAKKLGIKIGMSVQEARFKVPSMAFVQADPTKYRSVISRVFGFLHELTDRVEHYSIDEAFLDFTGWFKDDLALIQPLLTVKQRIHREIGDWLHCSIGVAPTRLLAKMASDHQKPNGFTMVSHASSEAFLAQHKLTDVCGIGERNKRRLYRLGVYTILDLIRYPSENLIRLCGRDLYFLQIGLQGFETRRVENGRAEAPKSVGHSYSVPRKVNAEGNILSVFMKLVEKAGRRMRELNLCANAVSVAVSFHAAKISTQAEPVFFLRRFDSEHGSHRFMEPTADSFTLMEGALGLLNELWDGTRDVSFLAVTFFDLTVPQAQTAIDLGTNAWHDPQKKTRLTLAMDKVRDKYGNGSIMFGQIAKLTDEAPDRIGFRKVEGVEVPTSLS